MGDKPAILGISVPHCGTLIRSYSLVSGIDLPQRFASRYERSAAMGREDRRGIKAVEVSGRILDYLATAHAPVALRELAAAGRMSPGKVHRYLVSFLVSGLA